MHSPSLSSVPPPQPAGVQPVQQVPSSLWVAVAFGISVAVCHGIGRFGYALLLPAMRQDLGWTYELASWMNTANALGYVVGAVTGYLLLHRHSAARLFSVGLLMTVASVAVTGLSSSFAWLLCTRGLSGVGAAWAFACGGAMVAERFSAQAAVRGQATGAYFGCAGIGMVAAGLIVPAMLEQGGPAAWPGVWAVLGLLCAVLSVWPLREACKSRAGPVRRSEQRVELRGLGAAMLAYFLFAAAHTGYVFFVFAWTRAQALPWQLGAGTWVLLGLGVMASPVLWRGALNRWPPVRVLSACCAVTFAGSLLPVLSAHGAAVALSAAVVGAAIFIAPSAAALLVRQAMPSELWASGIAIFTVVFSVGQALGSWAMGWIADSFSLSASLAVASAGLLLAALVGLMGRRDSGPSVEAK